MNERQAGNDASGRRGGLWPTGLTIGLCLAAAAAPAVAQVNVRRPVQQSGRLLDVNPQIGAGGYNYARPVSPLIVGNALATGNIGGGLSLRTVSPISDPNVFRGPLGSGLLSAFRRDSVSVADVSSPYRGLLGTPYFDPSQTVYTSGFLIGWSAPPQPRLGALPAASGSSPPGGPGPLDLRLDTRLDVGSLAGTQSLISGVADLRSQIVGLTPGQTPELTSTIFGPAPPPPSPQRVDELVSAGLGRLPEPGVRAPTGFGPPELPRLEDPPGTRPLMGTPEEYVRSGELGRWPMDLDQDRLTPRADEQPALVFGPQLMNKWQADLKLGPQGLDRAPASPAIPRIRDVSLLPGYDLFTDMQLALALSADPNAAWFEEMQAAIRESAAAIDDPALAEMLQQSAATQSQEFLAQVLGAPIRTFHGPGESAANQELLEAESLLERGRYYEAVRRYEAAHRLNPLNPLPLIGKGNAFLASGEYLSAAVALVQGFERYPELSQFTFDLTSLMGGGEIVDIRRADLMRRLASRDDPRWRFLLGYLEYYGGDRESGMENLEKAAELDRSGSIISRFPAMLRGEGALPPPKLPGATPLLPETEPGGPLPGRSRPGSQDAKRKEP